MHDLRGQTAIATDSQFSDKESCITVLTKENNNLTKKEYVLKPLQCDRTTANSTDVFIHLKCTIK